MSDECSSGLIRSPACLCCVSPPSGPDAGTQQASVSAVACPVLLRRCPGGAGGMVLPPYSGTVGPSHGLIQTLCRPGSVRPLVEPTYELSCEGFV